MRRVNLMIKRVMDIMCSGIALVVLLPIMLLVLIFIKLSMPGPILFKQERVGKNGILFNILKFRTMKVDEQAESSHDFSKDAERLTTFGKLLRRTKVDELPQLVNVLLGQMSLVGPRPTLQEQVEQYDDIQIHRLDMRPGMTGLAQVNGNVSLTWGERIEYDLEYVSSFSLLLDLHILIKTLLVVVCGEEKFKNAKHKGAV